MSVNRLWPAFAGMIAFGLLCTAPAHPASSQGPPQAGAVAKTRVAIAFEMPDPRYTDDFRSDELAELRSAAASAVAGALDEKIRFLDFGTDADAPYLLLVRLDRAEGSHAQGPAEFGLHFELRGPEVRDEARAYVVFRTKDQYLSPIGEPGALLREIELAVRGAGHRDLVRGLLRHVPIAKDARFRHEPLGWTVQHDRVALCIDRDSRLTVVNVFPFDGGNATEAFEARVLSTDRPDGWIVSVADASVHPRMVEELEAADPGRVRVENVFVMEYRRFCRPAVVPAEEVDFSDAGEQQ